MYNLDRAENGILVTQALSTEKWKNTQRGQIQMPNSTFNRRPPETQVLKGKKLTRDEYVDVIRFRPGLPKLSDARVAYGSPHDASGPFFTLHTIVVSISRTTRPKLRVGAAPVP